MSVLMKQLIKGYHYVVYDLSDSRADDYFLGSSPLPMVAILIAYYQFTYNIGPKLMEKRQPFQLERVLILYNLFQIISNLYLFIKIVAHLPFFNYFCEPVNYSTTDEIALETLHMGWLYYLTKYVDLLDTVFFVLRKKHNQITFLHVYHHIGMVAGMWLGIRYVGGGSSIHLPLLNTFVHTVMYTYYLLSAWSTDMKQNLWWKKYITQLQIAQFLYLAVMYMQVLFRKSCGYPKWVLCIFIPQNMFMLILFSDFYWKAYIRPNRVKKVAE